ncbi:hypothetical protein WICMUC_002267 [Wickerhamomyces mucosus]|uniref:DUS-like FMN-binding domain-containing protein n=1 Tax=Wickerhamomyces mucosus TaxID=1378264 RepID=A0A9P8PPS0_9ASCO|nr:hypothetical protein WICMUC_002267 [Wickerhamomyces mucosus]
MVDYKGKLVLAPMVRAGELPTRLLALKHGAELVWSPEIIDKKIITCERFENTKLGTVDFLSKDKTRIPGVTNLVFRTYPKLESNKLIFQMGTSNIDLALEAAKLIINDVSGIDINAGCPKHFSIHSGMGAALLKTPDLLCSILENLVVKIGKPNNKPISVKIRLFPSEEDSLQLIERLCKTGISNLTVHCRTQPMRNREFPIRNYISKIKKITDFHKITLIINGGILDKSDFIKNIQSKYEDGKDLGGMIATTAEQNPTCFRDEPLPWYEMIKEYVNFAELVDNYIGNSKYMLLKMIPGRSKLYQIISQCKTYDDMKEVLKDVEPYKNDKFKATPFVTIKRDDNGNEITDKKKSTEKNFKDHINDGKKHKLPDSEKIQDQESTQLKKPHTEKTVTTA